MRSFIAHRLDHLQGIVTRWANRAKGLAEQGECLRLHRDCSHQVRLLEELRPLGHQAETAKDGRDEEDRGNRCCGDGALV